MYQFLLFRDGNGGWVVRFSLTVAAEEVGWTFGLLVMGNVVKLKVAVRGLDRGLPPS